MLAAIFIFKQASESKSASIILTSIMLALVQVPPIITNINPANQTSVISFTKNVWYGQVK